MAQAKRRKQSKTSQPPKERFLMLAQQTAKRLSVGAKRLGEQLRAMWDKVTQRIPILHRRVLVILVPIVLILLLLPSRGDKPASISVTEPRAIPIHLPEERPSDASPQRVEPIEQVIRPLTPTADVAKASPVAAKPVVVKPEPVVDAAPVTQSTSTNWQQHKIANGETLAAIFRDKDLPLKDLYAIAAIEGEDKPLSRVQAGQLLRFKQTAAGGVDVLQIERRNQESVVYVRLSDGTFFRSDR